MTAGTAPGQPHWRPDQLLGAKHDTPDQTGAVIDVEPIAGTPGTATAGQAARNWECGFCPLTFDRLSAAEEHVRSSHQQQFLAGAAAPAPAAMPATREQVIARLAAAFGPHKAAVSRKPDEDHRHPWTEFVPSGNDERGSTLIVFRDDDGQNSMRPLTYGEIADALCGPAAESASAPQPEVGDDIAEAEKVISRYREQVSRLTADNERMQDALREALDAEQPQAAPGPDAAS